jgi:hypothetical protein
LDDYILDFLGVYTPIIGVLWLFFPSLDHKQVGFFIVFGYRATHQASAVTIERAVKANDDVLIW